MNSSIAVFIKDKYEKDGYHGDYHFRYVEFYPNEPWFEVGGKLNLEIGKALFSLSTMHNEYFTHKVKTDWSTGDILDMDAESTNNLK